MIDIFGQIITFTWNALNYGFSVGDYRVTLWSVFKFGAITYIVMYFITKVVFAFKNER